MKFDYLKNKKKQKKTFFLVSQLLAFRHTKQNGKKCSEDNL